VGWVHSDGLHAALKQIKRRFSGKFWGIEIDNEWSLIKEPAIVLLTKKLAILQEYYQEIDRIKADLGMSLGTVSSTQSRISWAISMLELLSLRGFTSLTV
jgi:hypothetical protein